MRYGKLIMAVLAMTFAGAASAASARPAATMQAPSQVNSAAAPQTLMQGQRPGCGGDESMEALTARVFTVARSQAVMLEGCLGEDEFPATVNPKDGSLVKTNDTWWCSGFFPGTLWMIYKYGGDPQIKEMAIRQTGKLADLPSKNTSHDIGFMMDCSFGNAFKITGDPKYLPLLEASAAKLAARYNPTAGVIRSWDFGADRGWKYPVIIDNMMNLELLMDAFRWFGADSLRAIAVNHSMTTIRNHFREDGSTFHLVDYDPGSGDVHLRKTHQGYADTSTWARGQAWALYGFTMMYKHTGVEEFLGMAEKSAQWILGHLPQDGVPFWDYSQSDFKDASAAAIMASAFIQLYEVTGDRRYISTAESQLRTLSSENYLAAPGTNGGFILMHSVGNMPGRSEVDVPLSYADYYFLEALLLYRRATGHPRLYADDRDFAQVKAKVEADPESDLAALHRKIVETAASDDGAPFVKRFDSSHRRILDISRRVVSRIFSNAYLYRFTGDTVYLNRVESTINQACSFDSWNPSHYLDVAELAYGVAIGYDWLYHSLKPETLRNAERAVSQFAFTTALDTSDAWFYRRYHNWNQVCNGGLMTAAVAMRESCDTVTRRILLSGAVTNMICVNKIYYPTGCYGEGPSYWNYGTMYQCALNSMLDYALGADFGLSEVKGFDRTGNYVLSCYGASHKMFNYYDNSAAEYPSHPLWYFASRFRDPSQVFYEDRLIRDGKYGDTRFMPLALLWAADVDMSAIHSPERHLYASGGVTPIITARGDWTSSESDWYLGFNGGAANSNHGHIDGGSFVFDAFGCRWASDPGSTNYAEVEVKLKKTGGDYWDRSQNSQRWSVYPMNNDYHSVLTVDGHRFDVSGRGEIAEVYDEEGRWGGRLDTTPYYDNLSSASRSVFTDGKSLTVIDEFTASESVPVRWTLVTEAKVTIKGRSAVLSQCGRTMKLEMKGTRGCRYSVRDCPEAAQKGFTLVDITFVAPSGTTRTETTLK